MGEPSESRPIRAFLGLELGTGARHRAARVAEALHHSPGGDRVRWVRAEALHVTLRFLGSTDPGRIPHLVRHVGAECRGVAPFALRLGEASAFPSTRRPRVIALGLEPPAPVEALARAVEAGVVAAGFAPEERPFRPHVTLGRSCRGGRPFPPPLLNALTAVTVPVTGSDDAWDVVEIVLFESETSPSGARYTPLERIPVGPSREGPSQSHP